MAMLVVVAPDAATYSAGHDSAPAIPMRIADNKVGAS